MTSQYPSFLPPLRLNRFLVWSTSKSRCIVLSDTDILLAIDAAVFTTSFTTTLSVIPTISASCSRVVDGFLRISARMVSWVVVSVVSWVVVSAVNSANPMKLFFQDDPMSAISAAFILDVWHLGDMAFDGNNTFPGQ